MKDINYLITELVNYGIERGLVDELDRTYIINRLLETLGLDEYIKPEEKDGILAFRADPLDESWTTMV